MMIRWQVADTQASATSGTARCIIDHDTRLSLAERQGEGVHVLSPAEACMCGVDCEWQRMPDRRRSLWCGQPQCG